MAKTITLSEIKKIYTGLWSVKDNTPRGRKEKYFEDLKIGDEILLDNHFVEIVEE